MASEDATLAQALLNHANIIFASDGPGNLDRERDLDNAKRAVRLAERLLAGNATDEDRASVPELVHWGVRTTFGL